MKFAFLGTQYRRLHTCLREAGHKVLDLDYWAWMSGGDGEGDPGVNAGWWERSKRALNEQEMNDRILKAVSEWRPDVLIQFKGWYPDGSRIRPRTIKACREAYGCRSIYWSVDDPDFLPFWGHYFAEQGTWDAALTCCQASVGRYQHAGVPVAEYFLPGYDTTWPDVTTLPEPAVDLVIVGTAYWQVTGADIARARVALGAIERGWTVELYGDEVWKKDTHGEVKARHGQEVEPFVCGDPKLADHYRGWLLHDDVWRAYGRAKVVFNNHLRKGGGYDAHKYNGYCNDKIFQIAGFGGGVQVMDFQPGISPNVYQSGSEFLCYEAHTDPEEGLEAALDTIEVALEDEDRRKSIAEDAVNRTLANHTWEHRAAQLIDIANRIS